MKDDTNYDKINTGTCFHTAGSKWLVFDYILGQLLRTTLVKIKYLDEIGKIYKFIKFYS